MHKTPRTPLVALFALALALALSSAACGQDGNPTPNPNPVQGTFRVSECGGFAAASKSDAPGSYCASEVLDWRYDAAAQKLVLRDQRAVLNCCGDRSLAVRLEDGVYVVSETDAPQAGAGRCRCECSFDLEAELTNVAPGSLHLRLERNITDGGTDGGGVTTVLFDGQLDLSKPAGVEVLDSSSTSFCQEPAPTPAPTPKPLPQTATVSTCGGFAKAAKSDNGAPLGYCDAETLSFTHDAKTGRLELRNDRIVLNCCGDRGITATLEDGVYVLRETDAPEGGAGRCDCMCVFDFKVAVEQVPSQAIKVELRRAVLDAGAPEQSVWSGTLDLAQGSGSTVVDASNAAPWCQP